MDGKAGDLFGYNWVLQRARDIGDIKTVEALMKVGAPPWKDSKSILDARKWYAKYAPEKKTLSNT